MIKTLNNNRIELSKFIGKPEGFSYNYEKYEKISKGRLFRLCTRVVLCEQIRDKVILQITLYYKS